ncbi:MAG: 6-phosphofructokinase [Leptospirales bacterium]|nr:6-phosphofructokinase [Leptospirales bacterium]
MALKKIGILTSGGDCGGLNGVVKGAACVAEANGIEAYLIPNGYAGLYNLIDFDSLVRLDRARLEKFHVYMAGSEAGNSRVKVSKIKDEQKYERIKQGLQKFGLDAVVIAGGDDTGSVVVDLASKGIPCLHAPKTMDLDLMTYSVGGDSTINRIADFARDLRTTGNTHNRVIVMEVFGRYAGHTAFRGGIAAEADAILIPEVLVNFDLLYEHVKSVFTRRIRESDHRAGSVMVIVAEGLKDASGEELVDKSVAPDSFGHYPLMGAGKYVVKEIESRMKKDPAIKEFMKQTGQFVESVYEIPEVREIRPSHLVRCGHTTAVDAVFGLQVGAGAVELARQGIFGVTVVDYREGEVRYMDCARAIEQRHVDVSEIALYESLGISFGRKPVAAQPKLVKQSERPWRPH